MSPRSSDARALGAQLQGCAPVFAALGDMTRLHIIIKLCAGAPLSIAQLTDGATITRQAVTKHLDVLADAGLVRDVRSGRERRYELVTQPIEDVQACLEQVSAQWDAALQRLKQHVER
jgi:DNA-binding transcriptional ArsR family regulator